MASEMAEQPSRLAALLSRRGEIEKQVRSLAPADLAGTVLVARGSSDHAATCGAYFLEMATGRPVAFASPSILTLYRRRPTTPGYLLDRRQPVRPDPRDRRSGAGGAGQWRSGYRHHQ